MGHDVSNGWIPLEQVLSDLYDKRGLGGYYVRDVRYLRDAYFRIEELWNDVLDTMETIQFVLLAEAPMYGPAKSYFYNPGAGATEFFNYVNAEALVGPLVESSKLVNGIRARKKEMIARLIDRGILIVDIFPYALKPEYTAIDYRRLERTSAYTQLCKRTLSHHLNPKLKALRPKLSNDAQFAFRYAGVREQLQNLVANSLGSTLGTTVASIPSVHDGRNMDTDKVKDLMYSEVCA